MLLSVECDVANIRLRVYSDTTSRTADVARAVDTAPTTASGIFLDFVTGASEIGLAPVPLGYTADATSTVPARVDHSLGVDTAIVLTVKFMELNA